MWGKLTLPSDQKKDVEKTVRQRFFRPEIYTWKIARGDDVVGYAALDNVLGKSLPITFLVVFDTEGVIQSTHIVKYRESHGGQVKLERWRKQFVGKTHESGYAVGRDIDGISGATISVNSVSRGIRKLTFMFETVKGSFN